MPKPDSLKTLAWLGSLRADVVFGWRRLKKTKTTSAAAVLSLALGIGACTAAFRLIDALLLKPLPVADADQLYALSRRGIGFDGKPQTFDAWAHPAFRRMRAAVQDHAELLAISYAVRSDVAYTSDQDIEKAYLQYVSGWMFGTFGLRPAAGRLLVEDDDDDPRAHPYAVLSYDYWARRFGRDPNVVGRTFRLGADVFEIVGVAEQTFTGTERGTAIDIFVPTMMHPRVDRSDATWIRTFARLEAGVAVEPVRARLHAASRAFEEERAQGFTGMARADIDRFLDQTLSLREPMLPVAYVPFRAIDPAGSLQPRRDAAFIVRTAESNLLAMGSVLRHEVTRARPEFRVSNVRTQLEINQAQTVRERLLAMLSLFFTTVAIVLAGVGLYGVLEYSVVQLRRDIGIRVALGAGTGAVARRVALHAFSMVLAGAIAGLVLSLASARYVEALLYGVKATDAVMLALPSLAVIAVAVLAAVIPIIRASRIDPAAILRAD